MIMSIVRTNAMSCSSALSTHSNWMAALDDAVGSALEPLGGAPDLALLFVSPHHAEAADKIVAAAISQLGSAKLIGCTGESIVGTGQEIEEAPAVSLWLARLPGVRLTPMHLRFERTPEG